MWKITKVVSVCLFKSEFYTLNYKIDNKIFKFNCHWHLDYKETNLYFLNGDSKLIYIIKIFIYVKID